MTGGDPILEQTLRLACVVRDSMEAESWRTAWRELGTLGRRSRRYTNTGACRLAIETPARDQGYSRPFLYPLLVEGYSGLNRSQVKAQLQPTPEIWSPYSKMLECMDTMGSILAFLRRARPGYPNHDLVYTVPNSPWMMLGADCEVPWAYGGHSIRLAEPVDATTLGLGAQLPSIGSQVTKAVNSLLAAIQATDVWQTLKRAQSQIRANRVLEQELAQVRAKFQAELEAYAKLGLPKPIRVRKALELADESFTTLRPRNQAYVTAFREYERILRNVYWLLSQVVIHRVIACVTSAYPERLQQVALTYGKDAALTAVATSQSPFEEPGLLVHVTLAEAGHAFDGLYQIDAKTLKWQLGAQARIILIMRHRWPCTLPHIQEAVGSAAGPIFVDDNFSPVQNTIDNRHIVFIDKDGKETDLRLRDWSPAFDETRTMHLA